MFERTHSGWLRGLRWTIPGSWSPGCRRRGIARGPAWWMPWPQCAPAVRTPWRWSSPTCRPSFRWEPLGWGTSPRCVAAWSPQRSASPPPHLPLPCADALRRPAHKQTRAQRESPGRDLQQEFKISNFLLRNQEQQIHPTEEFTSPLARTSQNMLPRASESYSGLNWTLRDRAPGHFERWTPVRLFFLVTSQIDNDVYLHALFYMLKKIMNACLRILRFI